LGQNFFVVFCLSLAAVAVVCGVTAFVAVAVALLVLFLVVLLQV